MPRSHEPAACAVAPSAPQVGGWAAPVWWRGSSDNLQASIVLVVALAFFMAMVTLIKVIGARVPLVEILLFRQVVMQVLIMPFILGDFPRVFRTGHLPLQMVRGLFALGAVWLGFGAFVHLPLAQATAISFTYAIFVTIGAGAILREKVGWQRWLATAIGLAGVVIMLGPSGKGSLFYASMALLGAICGAGMVLSLRVLSRGDRVDTILTYQALVTIAALIVPAWLSWVTPSFRDLMLLLIMGALGTLAQWLFTLAFRKGEAAALAPLDFVRLVLATITGLVFFGEALHPAVFVGAIFVVGATIYTFRNNAMERVAPIPRSAID